ncbi:MAG TPA: flagellar hook capping FlgD N-terminal domain-containing protein [Steroidobacteraceae bacterium]|jgi:flagellar basal-body rod modification protein FlgD
MTTPVNSVTGAQTPSGTSGTPGSNGLGGLTMNDFLTLMTAQLQHQDPLNPTDSNQFLSQLSELSTVEGISQLNTSMGTLSNSMLASQAVNSAALVGQTILAPASASELASGGSISGAVQVPSGAKSVTLSITNAAGVTVAQVAMPTGAGMQGFSWNGQSANGNTAPPGVYGVSAAAVVGNTSEAATTYLNGTVSSVTLDPGASGVLLNTPQLGSVALSNVQQLD